MQDITPLKQMNTPLGPNDYSLLVLAVRDAITMWEEMTDFFDNHDSGDMQSLAQAVHYQFQFENKMKALKELVGEG